MTLEYIEKILKTNNLTKVYLKLYFQGEKYFIEYYEVTNKIFPERVSVHDKNLENAFDKLLYELGVIE